jgi:hypothetical protein
MKSRPSPYRKIINRVLRKRLVELGFREVVLEDCISYEALFRKDKVWFGTSWDSRDQYLDLDFGHLYWAKDVMTRVVIAGHYSSFCDRVAHLDKHAPDYLEQIACTVAESLESALVNYNRNPSLGDSLVSRLRPHLMGRVADSGLGAHEA